MKISPVGVDLIKGFETLKLVAYKPTPDDVWTCGWGSTNGVTETTVWSKAEAEEHLLEDLNDAETCVNKRIHGLAITQNQYDALVSLAFNIGCGNFSGSTVLRCLLAGDDDGAANGFRLWVKQKDKKTGGMKTLAGLVRRRAAEEALFRTT